MGLTAQVFEKTTVCRKLAIQRTRFPNMHVQNTSIFKKSLQRLTKNMRKLKNGIQSPQ